MWKAIIIAMSMALIQGCDDTGTYNIVYPGWHYISYKDGSYDDRDKSISGNCLDYARAAQKVIGGEVWTCDTDAGLHAACIINGDEVYSVNEVWVLNKITVRWDWIEVIE